MNKAQLLEIMEELPPNAPILYSDPNFSGPYYQEPEPYDFIVENGALLISFPFEEEVD